MRLRLRKVDRERAGVAGVGGTSPVSVCWRGCGNVRCALRDIRSGSFHSPFHPPPIRGKMKQGVRVIPGAPGAAADGRSGGRPRTTVAGEAGLFAPTCSRDCGAPLPVPIKITWGGLSLLRRCAGA